MTLATERFKKIEQHIKHEGGGPDFNTFNMASWESEEVCGTTRCVAGWAIHDEINAPLYLGNGGEWSREILELTDRLGLKMPDFEAMGAKLLGLPPDMVGIFYANEDTAYEFVRRAARGDTEEQIRAWLHDPNRE